jgi:UPF0271 protein
MLNTGVVVIDLNADLAEGETLTATDVGVLDSVTSASLACGFHAGNRTVMRATAAACQDRGVTIGAHVSYRDREGFGRRALEVAPAELTRDIVEQCRVLAEAVDAVHARVRFVKPHGALYHRMGVDPRVAAAVVEAVGRLPDPVLVAQPGTVVVGLAGDAGVRVVAEGFPDRAYRPDGGLVPRGLPHAVVDDPRVAADRAVDLAARAGIEAVDGTWTDVKVETLCIHGDQPGADLTAARIRRALEAAGIIVAPFTGPADPAPAVGRSR